MLGAVEHIGGGLVDGHCARAGGGIWQLAGMQAQCVEIVVVVFVRVLGHGSAIRRQCGN